MAHLEIQRTTAEPLLLELLTEISERLGRIEEKIGRWEPLVDQYVSGSRFTAWRKTKNGGQI